MESKFNEVYDIAESIIITHYKKEMKKVIETKNMDDFNHVVYKTKRYIVDNQLVEDDEFLTHLITKSLSNLILERV